MGVSLKTKVFGVLGGLLVIVLLIAAFTSWMPYTSISANKVGVVFDQFNDGVQDKVLNEGFHIKAPWQKVTKISTEVQELTFSGLTLQTGDATWVNTTVQVQARVSQENAFEYFGRHGSKSFKDITSILQSTTQRSLESVSTKYTVVELLGGKRTEAVELMQNELTAQLVEEGITVSRLVLVDLEATAEVEKMIEREVLSKQEIVIAENKRKEAEVTAEKTLLEANATAEANRIISESLTGNILQMKFIEKWNSALPSVVGGDGLILDISKMIPAE